MEKKGRKEKKKDRWRIWDVFGFFLDILELLLYIPRLVIRLAKEL